MASAIAAPPVRAPRNLIGGEWRRASGTTALDIFAPATGEVVERLLEAGPADVEAAVAAATAAFAGWSQTPVTERVQCLYRFRQLLEDNIEPLAATLSLDQGKTLNEARGEVRRSIEFVEVALAAPMLLRGDKVEQVSRGIDTEIVREPLGVCVAITPFNFPVMNPTLFLAYAVACGNTFVLKPSEQDPLASTQLVELAAEAGMPDGVVNLLHGGRQVAEALIAHPDVRAVSAITSSPAARAIYTASAAAGKRVQANGGAKNPIVVLPDADLSSAVDNILSSAFAMAGQRCLAASKVVAVGDVGDALLEHLVRAAGDLAVGNPFDPQTTVGPLISAASRDRVERAIGAALEGGGDVLLDGRATVAADGRLGGGYYVGPTVIAGVGPDETLASEEVFGPVVTVHRTQTLDEAIAVCNLGDFGNSASLFTAAGGAARQFHRGIRAGNVGINIGVAAPTAPFSMGGLGDSFFGDLHVLGDQMFHFYTDHKVVISRW